MAELDNASPSDIVDCPECGLPAEVLDRFAMESTDGPVEMIKLRCVKGSPFLMPLAKLDVL